MAVKKPLLSRFREKPLEAGVEVLSTVAQPVIHEMDQFVHDGWSQFLGTTEKPHQPSSSAAMQGDLHEGQEVSFAAEKPQENHPEIEAAMDYSADIRHAETTIRRQEQGEREQRIEEVRARIAQEESSSDRATSIAVETRVQGAGIYHETYYEDLERARNSNSPVDIVHQKVAKTRGFWNSVKAHGTSFLLSGERAVAQQVG